jgi:alpha-2-macroglobulin
MTRAIRITTTTLLLSSFFGLTLAAAPLEIVRSGPTGEIAALEEANEIRVVFAEPMVVLGRIPDPVRAPFFRITPHVEGSFRWSGTTTLIFTPREPLPYATRYEVTIDSSATSLAGNSLTKPSRFSFTTPTVRLLHTSWYRKDGQWDGPVVIGLYFNQKVSGNFQSHFRTELVPHDWSAPAISPRARSRMPAAAVERFEAKAKRARAAASADRPVMAFLTDEWDRDHFHDDPNLVVVETAPGIPPDSWVRVAISPEVRSAGGPAVPGHEQQYTVRLNPHLFVDDFSCVENCNPEQRHVVTLRVPVDWSALREAARVTDITDPARPVVLSPTLETERRTWPTTTASLPDLGYPQEPNRIYELKLDPSLRAANGEPLGYTFTGVVQLLHARAFTRFGDGHGVWERDGGAIVPFYARNMKRVRQWVEPLSEERLVPTIVALQKRHFRMKPDVAPIVRSLPVESNEIQSHGLDLSKHFERGTGIAWIAIEELEPLPGTATGTRRDLASTVVQVSDLGISVKSSAQNTLVFVTRLSDGSPVPGATVRIRDTNNKILWSGRTGPDGVAMAPGVDPGENWWELRFIITAEKDGDLAYIGSDWNEGIRSWDFGHWYVPEEAKPLLRGTIFTDRGVYKPSEEIHFKAIIRSDTPEAMKPLDSGTQISITLVDSRGSKVNERVMPLSAWSSTDWTFTLPDDARLGTYSIEGSIKGQTGTVHGSFLVAAYRRPDFRVDIDLSGESAIAGATLEGSTQARYLFGAPMSGRDVRWTYSKTPTYNVPRPIRDRFPEQTFHFLGSPWTLERSFESGAISQREESLGGDGTLSLALPTKTDAGIPYVYTLESEVTDVSRQRIANRGSFVVHPAPWYLGFKPIPYFVRAEDGIATEIIAARPDGTLAPSVDVELKLTQIQWHSVRRGEGSGFYQWETERREIDRGRWSVTSADEPVPLHLPITEGGYYLLTATASDGEGRSTISWDSFYALGAGYTAWQRFDHNRIDLVPERGVYRPGETARIMVKSPWETATGLLTVEREGVRSYHPFNLTSTQQTVEVPIAEAHIPNTFVSVLLIKGRTSDVLDDEGADPGKPAFRLGYVELEVVDDLKRLDVDVSANREEFRPATEAEITVVVRDHAGRPARAEVTLWAVDYGVLSLTNYSPPDVAGSVWVKKALQVVTGDSRQRIISRRVLTPKGSTDGGGGGDPGAIRKDFRVLAFWLGSVETDANGRITTRVTLPESLTTYRIMAVAADRDSRFGSADTEIRINKPVLLSAAFPRFLALGDEAYFGAVVHSQLARSGRAIVTIESLDPEILEFRGNTRQRVSIAREGSSEVRFDARAKSVGAARVRMTVSLRGETDAFEDTIPVEILASPEVVAAYGDTDDRAEESLQVPSGVIPSIGGLHVELSSTAMVGLSEGARYLIEYPYGCAEQRASRTVALLFATDLGEAFPLEGIDARALRPVVQSALRELDTFQCDDGGFAFWKGNCATASPYLTSYIVHVYQQARSLGYEVDENVLERAYSYLERMLSEPPPVNDGWWPSYTAWQTYAVKVLTEGGRNQDSNINRLYGFLDRMPIFAISYLWDAMVAKGETGGARVGELRRRIGNSILPEGGSAHVEELSDPYLLWFWSSNVRSTAIALRSIVKNSDDRSLVRGMVRWLMEVRDNGRWSNTQENALAMEALVAYYRKYEATPPDFSATVTLADQTISTEEFRGRSTESRSTAVPMQELMRRVDTPDPVSLVFTKDGPGTLFYLTRLKYASSELQLHGLDQGFRIERSYASQTEPRSPKTTFQAGELVRVTLRITVPKERRWVAVTDPVPAGFEPVESMFATTATDLAEEQRDEHRGGDWFAWWQRGGFDHVERHGERVNLFATRLAAGTHEYSYTVRATTAGTFRTAPTHAEEMYEPEVFGRTASDVIEVKR